MRRRVAPLLLLLLLPLLAGTACVSVRPWQPCAAPCADERVERAQTVRVVSWDDRELLIEHPHPGMDAHGRFISGQGETLDGHALGPVRVYAEQICWIDTRRVQPGRVAANVVLVPLAVATTLAAAYYGDNIDLDLFTTIDPQSDEVHCPHPRPPPGTRSSDDDDGDAGQAPPP